MLYFLLAITPANIANHEGVENMKMVLGADVVAVLSGEERGDK